MRTQVLFSPGRPPFMTIQPRPYCRPPGGTRTKVFCSTVSAGDRLHEQGLDTLEVLVEVGKPEDLRGVHQEHDRQRLYVQDNPSPGSGFPSETGAGGLGRASPLDSGYRGRRCGRSRCPDQNRDQSRDGGGPCSNASQTGHEGCLCWRKKKRACSTTASSAPSTSSWA